MKNLLTFVAIASLTLMSAGAQVVRSLDMAATHNSLSLKRVDLPATAQEMKRNTMIGPAETQMKAPTEDRPFYYRPAGAFHSRFIAKNGAGMFSYGDYSFMLVKPLSDYTYLAENVGNYYYFWPYETPEGMSMDDNRKHVVSYGFTEGEPPQLCFADPSDESGLIHYFQYPTYYGCWGDNSGIWPLRGGDNPIFEDEECYQLVVPTVNSAMYLDEDEEFLLSSKTMAGNGTFATLLTRLHGAEAYGTNKYGWWFGKNGEHIDGIAQAFEKPTHPYILTKVFLQTYLDLQVSDDVTMTCKVYKLDKIPAYVPGDCATLPEEPGELILQGEALVTPSTAEEKNGLIEFNLYYWDEDYPDLIFEYTPTIDFPILICIDGYNAPEMENLKEFSAFVSANWNTDEGYGELSYLKCPLYEVELDENGDTIKDERERPVTSFQGHYYWCGLNNFFSGPQEMKTGLTIFIAVENPYLAFKNYVDCGVYEFGVQGGVMLQEIDNEVVEGIQFNAWTPSCEGDWILTWNGEEELPEWLNIDLVDGMEDGEFNNIVTAHVTAEPLPEGLRYREAVIRFEIPGAYLDYKFIQGTKVFPPKPPCFPGDEITIAYINYIIDLILNGMYDYCGDVNSDGEVNIADVNAIIDIILWE